LGGLATSILFEGYKIDIGPHYITIPKNSELAKDVKELVGEQEIVELPNTIFKEYYQTFFNGRLYSGYPTLWDVIFRSGFKFFIKSILFFIIGKIKKGTGNLSINDVEEYLKLNYGNFLYEIWFKPYLHKRYPSNNPPIDEIQKKFPPITMKKLLDRTDKIQEKNAGHKNSMDNQTHIWYFKNGMVSLINSLEREIHAKGGKIIQGVDIKKINHENTKKVTFVKDKEECNVTSDLIIYSTPLPITLFWFDKPSLKYNFPKNVIPEHSIMVFLFVDSPKLYDSWVVIFYDKELTFSRIAQQNFLSEHVVPKGKTLLSVEIRVPEGDSKWKLTNSEIIQKVTHDLKKTKIIKNEKIDGYKILKLKNIYTPITSDIKKMNEQITNFINSFDGEYTIGTENDSGTLAESRLEPDESLRIEYGGGIFSAFMKSEKLTKVILTKLNKSEFQ